jgi:exodeoxyribonuclease V alpha subunit
LDYSIERLDEISRSDERGLSLEYAGSQPIITVLYNGTTIGINMGEATLLPEAQIEGVIDTITFTNEENGYTVAKLIEDGTRNKVTIVGKMPAIQPGETVLVSGLWTTHPQFGRQLEVANLRVRPPQTLDGIKRYLASGLIKGVGKVTAERIADQFGMDTLKVLDEDPARLIEIPKIGRKRAKLIASSWQEQKQIKDVMIFLQNYGIGVALGIKIYKQYGNTAIEIVRRDPYQLVRDITGIGFPTADKIALEMGLDKESPTRIQAGLVHTLETMSQDGHCYAVQDELMSKCSQLLHLDEVLCRQQLEDLLARKSLLGDGEAVYLPYLYQSELIVAERLVQLNQAPKDRLSIFANIDWAAALEGLNRSTEIELTDEQLKAVQMAVSNKVSVLTGGPGTGKSTITGSIIRLLLSFGQSVILAAPTGRAAKRLAETTGMEALTIHRLLEYSPTGNTFMRNHKKPINADMLIVDETSMVDILLMHHLMDAIPDGMHILFIGDADQLPSVGPGNVLRDMISSEILPVQRLTRIFRQSENSFIIENAHRINQGQSPIFSKDAIDFFLFSMEDPQKAENWIVDIVSQRLKKKFGTTIKDIQVLSPMYRGPAGVNNLNQRLQITLNPPGRQSFELQHGDRLLRVGDRVMQIRNNYDKLVFNGDIGLISRINPVDQWLQVNFEDRLVQYEFSQLDELQLAYAISIHKSQGSEFPVVVIPVLTNHFIMLQRNLIYTAVTRARKIVVLVGSRRAISIAVQNNSTSERNTSLSRRLQQYMTQT